MFCLTDLLKHNCILTVNHTVAIPFEREDQAYHHDKHIHIDLLDVNVNDLLRQGFQVYACTFLFV